MKNIYVTLIILITFTPSLIYSAKIKKKLLKTTSESTETTTAQPAIIAIEIVDPNENNTNTKNSKRTIESALGYGYNSYDATKPRYEVYKYSQHDIPPYKGSSTSNFRRTPIAPVNIQKSIQYTLPPVTEHTQDSKNILTPGTTLYSSLNAKGQVGGLKSSLSDISGLEHQHVPVPVIVLRIYPDQLQSSTIQANLPEDHPFSKSINSINIQSLLLQYLKGLQNPSLAGTQHAQFSVTQTPPHSYISNNAYITPTQAPVRKTINDYAYQMPNYYTQNTHQNPALYKISNGETGSYQYYQQAYPQEQNYRHNQYQQPKYTDYRKGVQVQEAPVKYQLSYESSGSQEESSQTPGQAPQYYYVQPRPSINYDAGAAQYYQPSQNTKYKEQIHHSAPDVTEYYPTKELPYSASYQGTQKGTYGSKKPSLLTTENYPSNKHTKVIFRTETGNIRTPEQEETDAKDVKTIKIHVPNNIANVEVQESQKPYYGFQQTYEEGQQENSETYNQEQEYSNAADPNNYYLSQDAQQGSYYSNDEQDPNDSYGYQNINYEQMVKYLGRRGTMPSYSYRTEGNESDNTGRLSADKLADIYEEAAFPSTTQSPEKKKVKSKKRT